MRPLYLKTALSTNMVMPRRKYGRLRKTVEIPSKEKCSRCRSGKYCPIPDHIGNVVASNREWTGPAKISKRKKKVRS